VLLDKKTRLRLAFQILDRFNDRDLDWDLESTNLVLRTYGLSVLSRDFDGPSLHNIIGDATDQQLLDLAEYFSLETPKDAAPKSQVATVGAARPLVVFGSHLSEHKVLVGAVRTELLKYGIELFVAHDTIEHDTLWQDEIEKALDLADAGLVFVHSKLRDSPWCDQEIGWLQGRHVPVMALRFDGTPYGFFAKHQAQPVPMNATPTAIAEMTVDRIASKAELTSGFAASLVSAMASSPNFATTDAIWKRLRELSFLDADLCSKLLEATKTNTQIHWANSPWDGGESYRGVIVEFLQRQPGAAVVESDIQAYAQYLDQQDAEDEKRHEEIRQQLRRRVAEEAAQDPFA
jgi:TIR domain